MNKKLPDSQQRKLIDRFAPHSSFGKMIGFWSTSYEFQSEFFETDFLPSLLGLGAWDDRNWSSRIALEKQLAELDSATVLFDARPYRGRPRSLRIEAVPVHLAKGRLLHAKVVLAVYTNCVRLIVGSANLTEPGYRRNREVVAILSASERQSNDAGLILDAIENVPIELASSDNSTSADLFRQAKAMLNIWRDEKEAAASNQWFAWSGDGEPLWKQFLRRWPQGNPIKRISIVSPFWSEELQEGPLTRIKTELQAIAPFDAAIEFELYTEAAPENQAIYKPRLPESFYQFDSDAFGVPVFARAVDPRVPPEEVDMNQDFTGTRALHAKVVLLEGDDLALAYIGSANFTNRGWGFSTFAAPNIEAGMIILQNGSRAQVLRNLVPVTVGDRLLLQGEAFGKIIIPESVPEGLPWPGFICEVLLAPSEEEACRLELVLSVDSDSIEGSWSLSLNQTDDGDGVNTLLRGDRENGTTLYRKNLGESELAQLLREQEVLIQWWGCDSGRPFPVNVAPEARTNLPMSPEVGVPSESQLVQYYQGQVTWEGLFPELGAQVDSESQNASVSSEIGVDTSRIQSYLIREFVEALKGINDDLKQAAQSTKGCMRMALLGSVSPVELARQIEKAVKSGERSPVAAGFQLVEILACLGFARRYEAATLFKVEWLATIAEAEREVADLLSCLRRQFSTEFTGEFDLYANSLIDGSGCGAQE